jgi:hypothetical protein
MFYQFLPLDDGDAVRAKRGFAFIDGQAVVASAMCAHEVGDFRGPGLGTRGDVIADSEVEPALGRANFIDGFDGSTQMLGVPVFEINRRPFRENDRVMRRLCSIQTCMLEASSA